MAAGPVQGRGPSETKPQGGRRVAALIEVARGQPAKNGEFELT